MSDVPKTTAGKVAMIMALLEDTEVCQECGQETKKKPIMTIEEAKKLLGFKDE